jgi:putative protease
LKVEGRNRSAYYAAVTARAYRMAIDDWRRDPVRWSADAYMRELATIPNRGYSLAFHDGKLTHHAHNFEDTHTLAAWEYAGMIVDIAEDAFLLEEPPGDGRRSGIRASHKARTAPLTHLRV